MYLMTKGPVHELVKGIECNNSAYTVLKEY